MRPLPPPLVALLAGGLLLAVAPGAPARTPGDPAPAVAGEIAPATVPRRPNVLLVTFDTTRRDHLSCYGHDVLTTPVVDALAAAGTRFTDCLAVVPITGPSHASMLSGMHPQQHGAFRNGVRVLKDTVLLPEILKRHGWATGAAVAGWTLKDAQCGLGRGFDTYDEGGMTQRYSVVNVMRAADGVTDAALAFVDGATAKDPAAPWFLFAHYFDPHEPYQAPPAAALPPNPAASGAPRHEVHRQHLAAYDQEIAFADRELGRLLDGLRARGELEDALVIFTTDHGQSFGDNGYGGPQGEHGRRVYQSQVAAPLIVSWPGRLPRGATNALPVSHVDLAPTIVELLGLPASELPVDIPGSSLAKVLGDPSAAPPWGRASRVRRGLAFRGAVGNKWNIFRWMQNKKVDQAEPLFAFEVVEGRKVIVDFSRRDRVEVFDLARDPGERENLAGRTDVEARAAGGVFAWYDRTRASKLEAPVPTAEELESLRALGYVE